MKKIIENLIENNTIKNNFQHARRKAVNRHEQSANPNEPFLREQTIEPTGSKL